MAVITSNVISSAVSEFYDRAHLEVARPMLTYAKWSTKKRLKFQSTLPQGERHRHCGIP